MEPLQEIKDRLAALPAWQRKQQQSTETIRRAEEACRSLRQQYAREQGDVDRMQEEGLSAFLLRMVGRYDKKMEKEQQEAFAAKEQLDDANDYLATLQQERQEIDRRVQELALLEREYRQALEQRRQQLQQSFSGDAGRRYAQLEDERRELLCQITEVDEALRVAKRAISCAEEAATALSNASGWATYDVFFKGGILTHAAKYSHIDNADACFHRLTSLLRELRTELADVKHFSSPQFEEISSGQRAMDFWFDNIFTDYSVHSKVQSNAGRVQQLLSQLRSIQGRLQTQRSTLSSLRDDNLREEEQLLVSL